jgi:hypothetical protein
VGTGNGSDADFAAKGMWYVWLEPDAYVVSVHAPNALVGRDAAGRVVVTTLLDGARCATTLCRDLR